MAELFTTQATRAAALEAASRSLAPAKVNPMYNVIEHAASIINLAVLLDYWVATGERPKR